MHSISSRDFGVKTILFHYQMSITGLVQRRVYSYVSTQSGMYDDVPEN